MSAEAIISLIIMGLGLIITVLGWVSSIIKGDIKKDILVYIEEAEETGKSGEEKLQYVINKVAEKYKVFKFVIDVKKFVDKIIKLTKKVNTK